VVTINTVVSSFRMSVFGNQDLKLLGSPHTDHALSVSSHIPVDVHQIGQRTQSDSLSAQSSMVDDVSHGGVHYQFSDVEVSGGFISGYSPPSSFQRPYF